MNILLWVLQIVLALLYIPGGAGKIFMFDQLSLQVASMKALPQSLWTLLGACEWLAALGLILPGATKVLPILTPIAAVCLAVEAIVITILHASYGEVTPMIWSLVMGLMAAFISYGRFKVKQF